MRTEKHNVILADGLRASDRADDPGDGVGMSAAVEGGAGIVEVQSLEGCCEVVGIALPPHLAVCDDVKSCIFLGLDRNHRGILLSLWKMIGLDSPQLTGADARRKAAGELRPVDQPFRLRVAAHQRSGKERQRNHPSMFRAVTKPCPSSLRPGVAAPLRALLASPPRIPRRRARFVDGRGPRRAAEDRWGSWRPGRLS